VCGFLTLGLEGFLLSSEELSLESFFFYWGKGMNCSSTWVVLVVALGLEVEGRVVFLVVGLDGVESLLEASESMSEIYFRFRN